jgi:hypothetical protein
MAQKDAGYSKNDCRASLQPVACLYKPRDNPQKKVLVTSGLVGWLPVNV